MPKLLLVERNGAVLAVKPEAEQLRPSDVLVRMKLTDPQFWRFLLQSCDRLGVPGQPHLQSSAPCDGRQPGGSHARA